MVTGTVVRRRSGGTAFGAVAALAFADASDRRRPALVDVVLVAAAIIVVIGTVTLYPVVGSGGASA